MSNIEWTEATWNPIVGCSVVSPGCTNCYAMTMAARLEAMGTLPQYAGTTQKTKGGPVWTGKLALAPEATLAPLRRRKPTVYFVNSMGDLFHEDVPDEWIDRVFAVMALSPQHTFQILTKRSARMRRYFSGIDNGDGTWLDGAGWRDALIEGEAQALYSRLHKGEDPSLWLAVHLPLPNVWLGVSAEDQRRADERIPDLLATPAAIRFVSAEPLLGPIDFEPWLSWGDGDAEIDGKTWGCPGCDDGCGGCPEGKAHYHITEGEKDEDGIPEWMNAERVTLDWIIVGSESGARARPCDLGWVRAIRDQCVAAGTPLFWKQHVESGRKISTPELDGRRWVELPR